MYVETREAIVVRAVTTKQLNHDQADQVASWVDGWSAEQIGKWQGEERLHRSRWERTSGGVQCDLGGGSEIVEN